MLIDIERFLKWWGGEEEASNNKIITQASVEVNSIEPKIRNLKITTLSLKGY